MGLTFIKYSFGEVSEKQAEYLDISFTYSFVNQWPNVFTYERSFYKAASTRNAKDTVGKITNRMQKLNFDGKFAVVKLCN